MKVPFLLIVLLVVCRLGYSQKDWKSNPLSVPPVICHASDEVHRTFVEPPYELLNHLKASSTKKSNIVVVYDDQFIADTTARKAFQHAVDIWSYLVYSPVPIYIYAYWANLDAGVLGSCGPGKYYENFDQAPVKNTYYPVALVEKMTGEEITDKSVPDMTARFNKGFSNWYFGVDGKTPISKYDFVSIVLHEIGHGLGFTGMCYKSGQVGAYGLSLPYPGIFDRYMVNINDKYLTDSTSFKNGTSALLTELTSGSVRFKGQIPYEDAGLQYPYLYAPSVWDEGSSIYHLDENLYYAGNANSLMTPFAGKGEAIHDPGPMTLGIMYEMGWKFIQMKYDRHPDIEKIEDLKPIELYVNSDYDLDPAKLYLISSTDKFKTADSTLLKASSRADYYTGILPLKKQGTVDYYFSAKDKRNRIVRLPGIAPSKKYSINWGTDLIVPVLTHDKITLMKLEEKSVKFKVGAEDNVGVSFVKVEYIINNQSSKQLSLAEVAKNTFEGTLAFADGQLADGDSIRYRILAGDKAISQNTAMLPTTGYYTIKVEGIYKPVYTYSSNFNTASRDFISTDFTIKTLTGFDDGALHSLHPYKSPETDDGFYNYTALLKYPIIVKKGGKISFDEIVLVEPGESGAKYGEEDFYDYVVVEASKDEGKTWLPMFDGYDSNANKNWLSTYSSKIVSGNSTAVGTKALFVKRDFFVNQSGNFNVNDTIMVRFRLYSDPYSNGWGWCIDNLSIQDPITQAVALNYSPGEFLFYPNPVEDNLTFSGSFSQSPGTINLKLFNSFGQLVLQKDIPVYGNSVQEKINVASLASGMYIAVLELENGQKINRKVVKK